MRGSVWNLDCFWIGLCCDKIDKRVGSALWSRTACGCLLTREKVQKMEIA